MLQDAILFDNKASSTAVNCFNESGTFSDGGYNLENANSCGFSGTSLINTNPQLLHLANNGGPTPSMALPRTSPAVDRIPSGVHSCGTTVWADQVGVTRPYPGIFLGAPACDVGAFEVGFPTLYLPMVLKNK